MRSDAWFISRVLVDGDVPSMVSAEVAEYMKSYHRVMYFFMKD